MVSLASVSGAGGFLYLEIRRVELLEDRGNTSYLIDGMVGDGCDEAFIRVELSESTIVEIIPICGDDGLGDSLDERVGRAELTRLILDALRQIYFCIESSPGRKPGRVTGYADGGRLFGLHDPVVRPRSVYEVAEAGPFWQAA